MISYHSDYAVSPDSQWFWMLPCRTTLEAFVSAIDDYRSQNFVICRKWSPWGSNFIDLLMRICIVEHDGFILHVDYVVGSGRQGCGWWAEARGNGKHQQGSRLSVPGMVGRRPDPVCRIHRQVGSSLAGFDGVQIRLAALVVVWFASDVIVMFRN